MSLSQSSKTARDINNFKNSSSITHLWFTCFAEWILVIAQNTSWANCSSTVLSCTSKGTTKRYKSKSQDTSWSFTWRTVPIWRKTHRTNKSCRESLNQRKVKDLLDRNTTFTCSFWKPLIKVQCLKSTKKTVLWWIKFAHI